MPWPPVPTPGQRRGGVPRGWGPGSFSFCPPRLPKECAGSDGRERWRRGMSWGTTRQAEPTGSKQMKMLHLQTGDGDMLAQDLRGNRRGALSS